MQEECGTPPSMPVSAETVSTGMDLSVSAAHLVNFGMDMPVWPVRADKFGAQSPSSAYARTDYSGTAPTALCYVL